MRIEELDVGDIIKEIIYKNAPTITGPLVIIDKFRHGPNPYIEKNKQYPPYIEYTAKKLNGDMTYNPKGVEYSLNFNNRALSCSLGVEVIGKLEKTETIVKKVFPWETE